MGSSGGPESGEQNGSDLLPTPFPFDGSHENENENANADANESRPAAAGGLSLWILRQSSFISCLGGRGWDNGPSSSNMMTKFKSRKFQLLLLLLLLLSAARSDQSHSTRSACGQCRRRRRRRRRRRPRWAHYNGYYREVKRPQYPPSRAPLPGGVGTLSLGAKMIGRYKL